MSFPAIIKERWQSRQLVGQAKHQLVVRVRPGYMNKLYQVLQKLDGVHQDMPIIWKGINGQPWQGQWVPTGDWITLPEVESNSWTRQFSTNGTATNTTVMDNIAFMNTEGLAGVYHVIERGYFSPMRGVQVSSRPVLWEANEWKDALNGGYQIEVWEGYGPDGDASVTPLPAPVDGTCAPPDAAITRTFTGIIEQCEMESHPDKMTITARDFGIFTTDQRVMGWNKAREIVSPLHFADRRAVLGETKVGYNAAASSTLGGLSPSGVLPGGPGWVSAPQGAATDLQYIEITVPDGYYEQFFLGPACAGMEMWVTINVQDGDGGARWNGSIIAGGWLDIGAGTVPGTDIPYVRHWGNVQELAARWSLGGALSGDAGTVIRLYFTNLSPTDDFGVSRGGYCAAVLQLYAYRFGSDPKAMPSQALDNPGGDVNAYHWVLIDDVADIVRMVFMWCGFKEWDVTNFGWSLAEPFNIGQDQFFSDLLNDVLNQGNYVFYMQAPTDDDMSIGVPAFVPQSAVGPLPTYSIVASDNDLLETMEPAYDNSNLPYVIRFRGAITKSGVTLGQDLSKRYEATYFPPWSGQDYTKISPAKQGKTYDPAPRTAGVRRHFTETQGQVIALSLNSVQDCMFACILTAVQYALGQTTAQFQLPGLPGVELNTHASIVDTGSGMNSRVWISSISSAHNLGPNGSWHMTISGSLVDTEDLEMIAEDWAYSYYQYAIGRG